MSEDALTSRQREIVANAKQAFNDEDYAQAASLLEKLYEEVQLPEVNHLLVQALYMHEEYSRARMYAGEFLNSYLGTAADWRFLLTLLLRVHDFILAHEVTAGIHESTLRIESETLIEGAEQAARTETAATIKTVAKHFYHMSDDSVLEQQHRFQAAMKLPLAEFETGAKFLLLDPYLHPLYRASILEVLQRVQLDEPVSYRWLDEKTHEVVPAQLTPLDDDAIYQQVQKKLQDRLVDEDPVAETLLTQEVRLQLTLVYPRLNDVVTDPDEWVTGLIEIYRGDDQTVSESVSNWQRRLEQLTAELVANDD
ncbi:hypothetical protein ACRYI5_08590 [Furfurilactobacillus sp. WILCCON 0119]